MVHVKVELKPPLSEPMTIYFFT